MRISVLPRSLLGKWAVGLGAAFLFFFVLSNILMVFFHLGPGPIGPMIVLVSLIVGLGALVTGLISIIRYKDRGVLVCIATAFGVFVLLFLIGEILIPH
jgi:hypothetical protein